MALETVSFPVGHANLDSFMELAHAKFSDIRVVKKRSSVFMHLIYWGALMFIWQRKFLTGYNTIIGKTVYIVDTTIEEKNWDSIYTTLRHEFIHMLQDDKYGIGFKLGYLFPQVLVIFSIFALLAIWFSNYWLVSLAFLGALAPWPAPFRCKWEMEGYTASLLARHERGDRLDVRHIDWVVKQFVTSAYYFMSWGRAGVEAKVRIAIAKIKNGTINGIFLHYK